MARFTHLLQLMMMSSGLMRLFSMPIFGWSPRPRKSPGGSMRKFPILSLWLSMMQNPYSCRILSLSSLIFYRNAFEVIVRWGFRAWGHMLEWGFTCFSSFDICFLASDWALKYSFIPVKLHLFRSVILDFSSDVISYNKSHVVPHQTSTTLWREQTWASHLPPVLKEILSEDVFGCVLMIQHLGKKRGNLFSGSAEFHQLAYKKNQHCTSKQDKTN